MKKQRKHLETEKKGSSWRTVALTGRSREPGWASVVSIMSWKVRHSFIASKESVMITIVSTPIYVKVQRLNGSSSAASSFRKNK